MLKINQQNCIGCSLCTTFAKNVFKVEGTPPKAFVVRQPNPEEKTGVEQAIANCPLQVISYEEPMKMAA